MQQASGGIQLPEYVCVLNQEATKLLPGKVLLIERHKHI